MHTRLMNLILCILAVIVNSCGPIETSSNVDGSVYEVAVDGDGLTGDRFHGLEVVDCASRYDGLYLCLKEIGTESVEIYSNAYTWTTWPRMLYTAVVTIEGCESLRVYQEVEVVQHDWPHYRFSTTANALQIVEAHTQRIPLVNGCVIREQTRVVVELYSLLGSFPRQQLVVSGISHSSVMRH